MAHFLVVANETAASEELVGKLRDRVGSDDRVTVIAPINQPSSGYVVYEDTRRAAAGRRLDRTTKALRDAGIRADRLVVDADPVSAVRDALHQLEPAVDEILVSTHPKSESGWQRRNVVDSIRRVAGGIPVEHLVVDVHAGTGDANVLVIANETVVGEPLLNRIRERAERGKASFLIVCPQSDPSQGSHPEADRRLRRALAELRSDGIDAHGQVAHPDPFTAAIQAVHDERVDEIIVSTYGPDRSPWLRKSLVQRLHAETKLPVEHVVITAEALAGAGS